MTATSHFLGKADTYLADNPKYDPYSRHRAKTIKDQSMSYLEMTDTVRKGLLESLSYDPEEKGADVGSKVSGVSNLMGDADTTGAFTINTDATANRAMHQRICQTAGRITRMTHTAGKQNH
jgi:hypothetical protein